ncbi:hypothetical protein CDV36_016504 [Fusarium kuroshium]|uniref:Uncharacterized protein n=1 Tax=Fusarium kuroshium TaxID=2010991 RepID=A0A3M2QLX0_9HYPO|nr:hypothetical protein CDV36_016504 [Fusarium kuroshium]
MAKPDLAPIATSPNPRRSFGGSSGTRKRSQRKQTSYAYLRQQKWAKNKTSYASGTGRGQGMGARDQLEAMLVDSVDSMNMKLPRGGETNPSIPDIVIHPPSDNSDADVEILCARIDAQLGRRVEMGVLEEEGPQTT